MYPQRPIAMHLPRIASCEGTFYHLSDKTSIFNPRSNQKDDHTEEIPLKSNSAPLPTQRAR